MTLWTVLHIAITALGVIATALLVGASIYGTSLVALLSLLSVVAAIATSIYGVGGLPLLGAALAGGVGLGGVISVWRSGNAPTATARLLRLISAGSCTAVALILIVPRFPLTHTADRVAWASVGFVTFWVYAVLANPRASGRQASEPDIGPSPKGPPVLSFALDLCAFAVSVVWAITNILGFESDAILVVGLVLIFIEWTGMVVGQIAHPSRLLRGLPVAGMGWVGLVASLIGWAWATHELSSYEIQAYGFMLVGVGPSLIVWVLFMRPFLSGEATFPNILTRSWGRMWHRQSSGD